MSLVDSIALATAWGAAELIESDDTGAVQYPQVATVAEGKAIVVRHQFDGNCYNIRAHRFE
jgi:hypothetical protein